MIDGLATNSVLVQHRLPKLKRILYFVHLEPMAKHLSHVVSWRGYRNVYWKWIQLLIRLLAY